MNLVRVALIGVALGLLAIGLPGSEDTPARQQPAQICLVPPDSPPMMQAFLAASDRVYQPSSPSRPSPLATYPTSPFPLAIQVETKPEPVVSAEPPRPQETRQPWMEETKQDWEEEELPVEEDEKEAVSLVALNRPISLNPAYLYTETARTPRRSVKRHVSSRETTERVRKLPPEHLSSAREPQLEADLEQAGEKLTGVLKGRRPAAVDAEYEQAEAYPPATARFRPPQRSDLRAP